MNQVNLGLCLVKGWQKSSEKNVLLQLPDETVDDIHEWKSMEICFRTSATCFLTPGSVLRFMIHVAFVFTLSRELAVLALARIVCADIRSQNGIAILAQACSHCEIKNSFLLSPC